MAISVAEAAASPEHGTTNDFAHEYDQTLRDIVDYVYDFEITNPAAWDNARYALLDALGCAIETLATTPDCVKMVGPVVRGTVVPGGSRIPGTALEVDPVKGAFDIGCLVRYLDHNDAYTGKEWGHPSDNLAAILSVSDWLSRRTPNSHISFASHFAHPDATFFSPAPTLRTLLACLIKAYEIQGTLQALNEFNEHGLDHVLLVKVASIAVISPLLGLSKDQALAAVSQAWQDGSPLRIYRQAPNTSARKGWAAGDAASRAVHLALLTSQGQQGSPTVLSCPKWGFRDVCFAGKEIKLPRPYGTKVVETVFFKIVPAEGHGLSAIEAALDIVSQLDSRGIVFGHGRNWELINRIEIRTTKAGHSIINKSGPLRGYADRDHCLQYMVAVALLKGSVIDCPDYDDSSPWASDLRIDALRGKMIVVEDASFTRDYYDPKVRSAANQVIITLQDSTQLEARRDYALGHHSNPQTLPSVRAKYHHNLGRKFQDPRVSLIEKTVMTPGCWDMKVCEFVDLLVVPEAISIPDIPCTPATSPSVVTLLGKYQGQTSNESLLERIERPQIHSAGSVSPTLHEAQSMCSNDSPSDMEKLGETKHVTASRKSRSSVLGCFRRFRPCRSLRKLMQKI